VDRPTASARPLAALLPFLYPRALSWRKRYEVFTQEGGGHPRLLERHGHGVPFTDTNTRTTTMRYILIAAAFTAGAFLATTAAKAQVAYHAGGPVQIGNMCRVNTDTAADGGQQLDRYGYYAPCGNDALAQAPAPRHWR
jgi:hypothetical protein